MAQPTDNRTTIVDHLAGLADGATAREVSDATGIGYSTVTEHLRALADDGTVLREKSGRQVTWALKSGEVVAPAEPGEPTPVPIQEETAETGYAVTRFPSPDYDGEYPEQPAPDAPQRAASETGARVVDEVADESGPVPIRVDPEPAETAVAASDALTPTDVPADTPSPVLSESSGVGDVLAFMEGERPIPPAPETPARRSATPVRDLDVKRDHKPGELKSRILSYLDEHHKTEPIGPSALAKALHAHAGSVVYALQQFARKGEVTFVGEPGKPAYRLATREEYTAANPAPPAE